MKEVPGTFGGHVRVTSDAHPDALHVRRLIAAINGGGAIQNEPPPVHTPAPIQPQPKQPIVPDRAFTYADIKKITDNFQKRIGKGGSAIVYHGRLLTDGREVAVKVVNDQGAKAFVTEVRLLLTVNHKSLAGFVGYCEEGQNLILVYEFMKGGDLRKLLNGEGDTLTWEKRLEIAQSVATGLAYLHSDCEPQIIHRDVKTNNVLLNHKLEAKLADFGLCKENPNVDVTHMSTVAVGTPGYMDPAYYGTGRLTTKSDVYSFGVILLELISGLPPIVPMSDGTRLSLVEWATPLIQGNDLQSVTDPNLRGQYSAESVWEVAQTALFCTKKAPNHRPTMSEVVSVLRNAMAGAVHIFGEGETRTPTVDNPFTPPSSSTAPARPVRAATLTPRSMSSSEYSSSSHKGFGDPPAAR